MRILSRFIPPEATVDDIIQHVLLGLIRLALLAAIVWGVAAGQTETVIASCIGLVFSFFPHFIERRYKIVLPIEFDLFMVLFIYLSLGLGFAFDYFDRIWWWDDLLHTSSGVVLGFAGFCVLYVLYYQKKLVASAWWIAFVSVSIAVLLGVLWEIFEFAADSFFGTTMQPSLEDTMFDLIVDTLGATLPALLGYFYIKRKLPSFVGQYIRNFLDKNPRFERRLQKGSRL
jgi:hypothetical protein